MTNRMLLALLFAPVIAGCGSNNPTTTASANGSNSGASAAYAFSRCMRAHGLPNFPDPKVSVSPGHTSVAIAVNPSETASPKFKSAQQACQGILPAPMTPAQQQAHDQAKKRYLLAFALCLRTNGIRGFPDPDATGKLTLQMVAAAGVDIHTPKFLAAAKACVGVTHGAITLPQIQAAVNGQGG
jgi:hypothetical protein